MSFRRGRHLKLAVALLLVSYTFLEAAVLDLVVPGLCKEDQNSFHALSQLLSISSASHSKSPSPVNSTDHDCLCCCHHVVPQAIFDPDVFLTASPINPDFVLLPLLPDLLPPYRPPRV